ncbi:MULTISPECIES: tryptophan synthase subunit alpha [unclassified Haladaptatus]|uniref:tryptophan synthase subunit alpha n=1 Tax=unclassified Haladaptatus TaxID=2622732 RepID=UPI0023E844F5|nr:MULTISPECIES: tryptophan synthase subunit alpha [unclassified Haladaptatus]
MSEIGDAFREGPGLVPYITAGDPDAAATKEQVRALARGGADVIELGLPFSEPIADGPTIQNAIQRSLDAGMTPRSYLDLVADLDVDVPIVCMTYYNLIYQFGDEPVRAFVEAAAAAGIAGLIVPDLPVEESGVLRAACDEFGLDLIFIVAPTTRGDRLDRVMEQVSGFVYVQARLGTTGAQADVSSQTHDSLGRLADYDVPKAVGFGVSERHHAREIVAAGADGVVAGSVFVDLIAAGDEVATKLEQKAAELAEGARTGYSQRVPRPERT